MAQATISPSISVFQGRVGGWPGYPTFTDPTLFYIASPLTVNWASGPIVYTFSGGLGIPQQAQIPQTFFITLSDPSRNGTANVFIDTDAGRWSQAAQSTQPFAALGIIQTYVPGVGPPLGPITRSLVLGVLTSAVQHLRVVPVGGLFAMGAGDTDIYTVPPGKKAFPVECTYTNPTGSGGTVLCFAEYKSGGVYTKYDFIANNATAGTTGTVALLAPMLLNAGESFSVNIDNGGRLSLWPYILEFDDPGNLFVQRLTTFIAGDNTVMVCPSDGVSIMSNIENVGAGGVLKGTLWYFNNSGVGRTIGWNAVPSGGSPGNANQLTSGVVVGTPSILVKNFYGGSRAGDFFSINTDANTAGQVAWVIFQIN